MGEWVGFRLWEMKEGAWKEKPRRKATESPWHMKKRLLGVQGRGRERKGETDQQQQITCENVLMEPVTLYANLIIWKGEAEGLGRHLTG